VAVAVGYSLRMSSIEDKVWFDGERKLEGICGDIVDATARGSNVLVLAHFNSTLGIVEGKLRARSIEYKSFLPLDFSSLCPQDDAPPSVWVGQASYFQSKALSPQKRSQKSLEILIVEHHPMASRDRAIVEASSSVGCARRGVFHSSLTDPVLQR